MRHFWWYAPTFIHGLGAIHGRHIDLLSRKTTSQPLCFKQARFLFSRGLTETNTLPGLLGFSHTFFIFVQVTPTKQRRRRACWYLVRGFPPVKETATVCSRNRLEDTFSWIGGCALRRVERRSSGPFRDGSWEQLLACPRMDGKMQQQTSQSTVPCLTGATYTFTKAASARRLPSRRCLFPSDKRRVDRKARLLKPIRFGGDAGRQSV